MVVGISMLVTGSIVFLVLVGLIVCHLRKIVDLDEIGVVILLSISLWSITQGAKAIDGELDERREQRVESPVRS